MQFSEKWLRQWVDPPVDTASLTEALTMLGLEVDACEPVAGQFSGVVVAEVVSCEPHPNAERLHFCRVNTGDGILVDVVCGGVNVRKGLKVPFVKVGGVLPGGFNIKKVKLRGIESHGMICSIRELGLGEEASGTIMELAADAPIGVDLRDYLMLDDVMIDIELTPNRGDCASVMGVARDLAAHFQLPLQIPTIPAIPPQHEHQFPIVVHAKKECPRYVGRVIKNIRRNAVTPPWMQEYLRRSGFRLVHPVVDITHYVLLELGQPMHAFDLDQLAEKIEVRLSKSDEKLLLLDGQHLTLEEGMLVIADARGVQALAGVMGGAHSSVNEDTQNIFLESAYFEPSVVAQSSRYFGLTTDASYRFERGVDFALQTTAVQRFTELLHDICGGEPGTLIEIICQKNIPCRETITLRREQIQRTLGIRMPDKEVERILQSLGMHVQSDSAGWKVTPPTYRFDLSIEVDIIEELVRLYGYNHVPSTTLIGPLTLPKSSSSVLPYLRLQHLLMDLGYFEAITYSFVDPTWQRHFDPQGKFLSLTNPIASDMSVMRTSLWPGLVQALRYNLNRQAHRVCLFETGLCFIQQENGLEQREKIAGLLAGSAHDVQWTEKERSVDFFDIKGHVQQLFHFLHGEQAIVWRPSKHPALHPGQSAAIFLGEVFMGDVGALHPNLVSALDLSAAPFLFELNMLDMVSIKPTQYRNISKFPAVRRDLAIVIGEQISAGRIESKIKQYVGHLLLEVKIFDIYQGAGIEKGKKSMALSLLFQDTERTLVDEEVNTLVEGVVNGLQHEFNALLRA